ncbi:MAG TPA: LLM class flavin-dependent oxidoreductase [Frankiaceae bacterium]|jgi:alkanesulfonate monooxygenase SsuD/methylene tetrahydromethanopterin reductase-like flavin-dependent oxidoreductase (luciferase family)|nr:LLM class flavin-dependent oxidoreductase [Frankiaceae bacterium]
MEFGIFIQGYTPAFRREGNPDAEYDSFAYDIAAVEAADKAGFKYVWASEHHFLDEYSHLSANEVLLAYLAATTERIHLGSGIFNPLPQVNHPVKVAEKVAMLDHLSNGRFEFGTGRGAGSHEILGFLPDMKDLSGTREIWEDVIGEFPKMWMQDTYEGYEGKYWSLPPRKILPKPRFKPHPAMWYAAGNPSSYEMAAHKGLGVLGFSVGDFASAEKAVASYKKAISDAEPVGAFVNDNLMCCLAAYVAEDRDEAYRSYVDARPNYLVSNVFRYHDTFPHPEHVPAWPGRIPEPTLEDIPSYLDAGALLLGDPDDALRQAKVWESIGVDQLVFGVGPAPIEETVRTIELLGKHVIAKIDTNPEHRTTAFRRAAAAS